MERKYCYELWLRKQPPHDLLIIENGGVRFRNSLPELKSISLLVEAINSVISSSWHSDVKQFDDDDWLIWGTNDAIANFFEACGDLWFALGDKSVMMYCYEPVLDCDEDSDIFQRGQAKIAWVRWGTIPEPPSDDYEEDFDDEDDHLLDEEDDFDDDHLDDERRDCRYDVARLLAFRGDVHLSTGWYSGAFADYKTALDIYPNEKDLNLFGRPDTQPDEGVTFLQMVKKPLLYEKELRQFLDDLGATYSDKGHALAERKTSREWLEDVKAAASAWAKAGFPKHAIVLERVWKDHMKEVLKKQVKATADLLVNVLTVPTKPISLGLDLDGVIDEAANFFAVLTNVWPGDVFIITYRDDRDKSLADLESLGIKYTDVILVNSFAEKADVIARLGIDVYVDDQDEVLMHIPEGVTVLKLRNGGNYDAAQKKWLYSKITGRPV